MYSVSDTGVLLVTSPAVYHSLGRSPVRSMPRRPIPNPEPAPVLTVHIDGHRQVVHDFTGVPAIGLQQHTLGMTPAANASTVIEQTLAAAFHQIHFRITTQRVGKILVMGRHITVRRAGDGEHNGLMRFLDGFLYCRKHLVSKPIEAAGILLGLGV